MPFWLEMNWASARFFFTIYSWLKRERNGKMRDKRRTKKFKMWERSLRSWGRSGRRRWRPWWRGRSWLWRRLRKGSGRATSKRRQSSWISINKRWVPGELLMLYNCMMSSLLKNTVTFFSGLSCLKKRAPCVVKTVTVSCRYFPPLYKREGVRVEQPHGNWAVGAKSGHGAGAETTDQPH